MANGSVTAQATVRAWPEADEPTALRRLRVGFLAFIGADVVVCAALGLAVGRPWRDVPLLLACQIVAIACFGLYSDTRTRATNATLHEVGRLTGALATASWLFLGVLSLRGWAHPGLGRLSVGTLATIPVLALGRFAVRKILIRTGVAERILVVGAGLVGQSVALTLLRRGSGIRVVGLLDPEPRELDPQLQQLPLFTRVSELERALEETHATRVVIAFSRLQTKTVLSIVRACDRCGVDVDVVPRLYELFANRTRLDAVAGIPLLGLPPVRSNVLERAAKRAVDLVASTTLLLVLSPLIIVIALAIRLDSPGSPLFWHTRVGRGGRTFRMLKFRTMDKDAETRSQRLVATASPGSGRKLPGDDRVTRLGRILRRTSLDELPQLWNVLRGDMSLVGPRPLPIYEFAGREDAAGTRVAVPPGMSGLWQVLGRSEIDFDERMRLDYLYARNRSLAWDLRLLAETVGAVVRGRGAY